MNRKPHNFTGGILAAVLFLTACGISVVSGCGSNYDERLSTDESYEKVPVSSSFQVKDDNSLYYSPMENDVIYLTVGRNGTGSNEHTWKEINEHPISWYDENDTDLYDVDALLQFGDEDGALPESFGYDNVSANCSVRLYGENASNRQQKSYRIKIKSGSGDVSGVQTFILSKSFGDPFRFTNKLCFDLLSEIDPVLSVRTQMVHLYVKDETEKSGELFVDYGLYTMIETVNKRYLKNRNLDTSGELYKAESFDFGRHEDVIKQTTDASYNKQKFEELLKAKGSSDYSGLINMLDAVNDESQDIEKVVKKYFDEDNIYTWMAFNILVGNKDTDTENFYIYSPTGSDKFYFIPWDYDGALREDYELLKDADYSAGWNRGIHIYKQSKLFGRMMRNRHCSEKLSDRIDEVYDILLSNDNIYRKALGLSGETKNQLYSLPDMTFARTTGSNYDELIELLPQQIDSNYDDFYASLEKPWPFHILEPISKDGDITLSWSDSFMIEKDVTYDVELSQSWDFEQLLVSAENVKETSYNVGILPKGEYFARVTAVSPEGNKQEAYEYYKTEKKTTVHGVICFYVTDDGSVILSEFKDN